MNEQFRHSIQAAGNGNPPPKTKPVPTQSEPVEPVQEAPAEPVTQPVQN